LLRILDLEGIVKEFRGFYMLASLFAATSSKGEFFGMAHGNLQYPELAVSNKNLVLATDGSFCYLSVIIRTFK